MSSLVPHELVEFLTRNQILGSSALETLAREWQQYTTAAQMTEDLIARGWLTKFQQAHLLNGEGEKLILGPYRLIESLGEGGMGVVLKGWHPRLDRYVALKLIRPTVLASRPEIVTRFHREARAIAQLHHPNIVMLYDADEVNGTHFIAMEFVDGVTLEKMVRQSGPLAVKQSCDYMRQSALGLQHATECGLVHRDIKPSNILVAQKSSSMGKRSSTQLKRPALVTIRDRELAVDATMNGRSEHAWGSIKILDMGLARLQESLEEEDEKNPATPLTRAGALLGTPDFISPEQARDARSVDIRADLYSLGCTFYYILTGRPPFPGGNDVQKLIRHQSEKPYPIQELRPHTPTFVVDVVEKLMAKKVEDRYKTPLELAELLTDYLASTQTQSTPPRGMSATEPMMSMPPHPSPIPRSPFIDEPPSPEMAQLAEGFDSSLELPEEEPATAMANQAISTNDVAPFAVVQGHTGVVSALTISADGQFAASGGVDGKIRIWDLTSNPPQEVALLPRPNTEIQTLAFAPDDPGYLVYGGSIQGNARLQRWDWTENRVFDWGGFAATDHRGIGGLTFSADGSMFAAGVGNFVVTWKVSKRNASSRNIMKGQGYIVRSLAFSPDHRLLVTAGEGRAIRFWGFGWLGTSLKATVEAPGASITALSFSPDGKRLATVGLDRQVVLWDPLTPTEDSSIVLSGHTNTLRIIQFLPNGKHLVSLGESGQVYFWDIQTSSVVQDFQLEVSMVYSIAISRDGRRIIAGYSNGQLAFFNLRPNLGGPAPLTRAVAGKH